VASGLCEGVIVSFFLALGHVVREFVLVFAVAVGGEDRVKCMAVS